MFELHRLLPVLAGKELFEGCQGCVDMAFYGAYRQAEFFSDFFMRQAVEAGQGEYLAAFGGHFLESHVE